MLNYLNLCKNISRFTNCTERRSASGQRTVTIVASERTEIMHVPSGEKILTVAKTDSQYLAPLKYLLKIKRLSDDD